MEQEGVKKIVKITVFCFHWTAPFPALLPANTGKSSIFQIEEERLGDGRIVGLFYYYFSIVTPRLA
jgi:hypothetical protein